MMIDRGKESFTQEEIEDLQVRLREHKEYESYSWPVLAKKIGDVSDSTLGLFSRGTYAGDNQLVAWRVNRYFLAEEARRLDTLSKPVTPGYRLTKTSRMMTTQLRWAHGGEMVAIVSAPGMGKTATFDQYCAVTPNAFKATMEPASSSVQPMLCEILRACGASGKASTAANLVQTLCMRLDGLNPLIIVDESQHLSDRALDQLRGLHDRLGCGIVLAGNPRVVERMNGRISEGDFAQLSSRVSWSKTYQVPFFEDVEILCEAWGVPMGRQREFLHKVTSLPGALRNLTQVMKMATLAAEGSDEERTLSHLKDAYTEMKQRSADALMVEAAA